MSNLTFALSFLCSKHHSVVGPVLPDLKKEFKGMSQNADTCGQNGQMLFRDSGTS